MSTMNRGRHGLFAQLIGLAKRAEEEDDEERKEDEEEAENDDTDGDGDTERDDDHDGAKKSKKAKKAKSEDKEDDESAEDEEDDEEAEDEDDKEKALVARERTRCSRVIAHGIKLGRIKEAGVMAFDTSMPAKAAISALTAMGKAGEQGLSARMRAFSSPAVGDGEAEVPGDSAKSLAAKMAAVYDRAIGRSVK